MKQSIVGTVLGVLILFISCVILPTYFMSIITYRDDLNKCQVAARNFIDMVIDNGSINERALSDINLSLASCTSTFSYKYYREEKILQPSEEEGFVDTIWVYTDVVDNVNWNTGDIITVVITQEGLNIYQRIAMIMPGASFAAPEIRLSGMVR